MAYWPPSPVSSTISSARACAPLRVLPLPRPPCQYRTRQVSSRGGMSWSGRASRRQRARGSSGALASLRSSSPTATASALAAGKLHLLGVCVSVVRQRDVLDARGRRLRLLLGLDRLDQPPQLAPELPQVADVLGDLVADRPVRRRDLDTRLALALRPHRHRLLLPCHLARNRRVRPHHGLADLEDGRGPV